MSTQKCNVFYVPCEKSVELELTVDQFDDCDEEWADILNENLDMFPEIKRGDIVSAFPDEKRYRNDGLFIFNGAKLTPLSPDEDEYGNIPTEYTVEEFNPTYWDAIITHNSIVWFTPKDHVYTNYTKVNDTLIRVDEEKYRFFFVSEDVDAFFTEYNKSASSGMAYYDFGVVECIGFDREDYDFLNENDGKKVVVIVNLE